MMSEVACEPELPPDEMMSGTNSANTTARSIAPSKYVIAVVVSISPTSNTDSQPPRFLSISSGAMSMYGASRASIPPSF